MPNHILIGERIKPFKKTIKVSSDKSISIRTILFASQAVGISKVSNLLESEDVLNKVKEIMEAAVDLNIPLIVEASIGLNWNEAH